MRKPMRHWGTLLCALCLLTSIAFADETPPPQDSELPCEDIPENGEFHDAAERMRNMSLTDWTDASLFQPDESFTRNEFYVILRRNFQGEFPGESERYDAELFPFPDLEIDPESELGQSLIFCYGKGLFRADESYGNGEKLIERGEILYRLFRMYQTLYKRLNAIPFEVEYEVTGFSDIKESDNFAQAVMWAVANEIASGHSDGTFSPTGEQGRCSRKHIALFLFRFSNLAIKLPEAEPTAFQSS